MLHLTELGFTVVVILLIWTIIVALLEVRKCRHLKYIDITLLNWHWAVVEEEINGTREVGERFPNEDELLVYEVQHPNLPRYPTKYPEAWFD